MPGSRAVDDDYERETLPDYDEEDARSAFSKTFSIKSGVSKAKLSSPRKLNR